MKMFALTKNVKTIGGFCNRLHILQFRLVHHFFVKNLHRLLLLLGLPLNGLIYE